MTPGALVFGPALWPGRLLNAAIGSLVAMLAARFAGEVAGRRAGIVAGVAVAVHPSLLANDTVTLTEPLALLLVLAALAYADRSRWAGVGTCCGLLMLTRPNAYLVVAIFAIWAWRVAGLRRAMLMLVLIGAIVTPWLVRNQIQVGTAKLTTSDGFTMAAVYGAPGREAGHFVDPALSSAYDDLGHRLAQFDEAAWNDMLMEEAIEGLRDDPGYVAHVVKQNSLGYFDISPELIQTPEIYDGRHMGVRERVRPLVLVASAAGLVGLATAIRDRRVLVLVLLTAQFVTLSLLTVAPPRLRAPFDLACCIGIGLLVAEARRRWTSDPAGAAGPPGPGDGRNGDQP